MRELAPDSLSEQRLETTEPTWGVHSAALSPLSCSPTASPAAAKKRTSAYVLT